MLQIQTSISHSNFQLGMYEQPHADTLTLRHVRDDEHAHVDFSSDESYDSEDSDDSDSKSV
jgi:hypothetical protein